MLIQKDQNTTLTLCRQFRVVVALLQFLFIFMPTQQHLHALSDFIFSWNLILDMEFISSVALEENVEEGRNCAKKNYGAKHM
jgi:hypothetical protein